MRVCLLKVTTPEPFLFTCRRAKKVGRVTTPELDPARRGFLRRLAGRALRGGIRIQGSTIVPRSQKGCADTNRRDTN
jgi:hypothetical protein